MFAIFIVSLAFFLFFLLCSAFKWPVLFVLFYYTVTECAHRLHWMHRTSWRRSWFVRFVRGIVNVHFYSWHTTILKSLERKQVMFACEPHGPMCLHLSFGFAAHGDDVIPAALADRTLVVAHWALRWVPIIRDVYSAFGVIDSDWETLDLALRQGYSLAISPSGVAGKHRALLDDSDSVVTIVRRQRVGFLYMAAKHGIDVVPILSPHESRGYRFVNQWLRFWPLVAFYNRLLLYSGERAQLYVGTPISTRAYDWRNEKSMNGLIDRFYKELAALAPDGVSVRFVDD